MVSELQNSKLGTYVIPGFSKKIQENICEEKKERKNKGKGKEWVKTKKKMLGTLL